MNAVARKATPSTEFEAPTFRFVPPPPPLDAVLAVPIARMIVRRLLRRNAIRSTEIEDWVGDLLVEAARKWPEFDVGRARPERYLNLIMERAAVALLRAKHALKRGNGRCKNLDDPTSLDLAASLAAHGPDPIDRHALRLDMANVTSRLSFTQQQICKLLSDMGTSAAARHLGVPRHRLLISIRQIRQHFRGAGLDAYLR